MHSWLLRGYHLSSCRGCWAGGGCTGEGCPQRSSFDNMILLYGHLHVHWISEVPDLLLVVMPVEPAGSGHQVTRHHQRDEDGKSDNRANEEETNVRQNRLLATSAISPMHNRWPSSALVLLWQNGVLQAVLTLSYRLVHLVSVKLCLLAEFKFPAVLLHFYCFRDFVLFTICTRHSTVHSLVVSYHGGVGYQSRPPLQHLGSKLQIFNPSQGIVVIDWRTDTTGTVDGNAVTPFVCVCAEKGKSISSESTRGA